MTERSVSKSWLQSIIQAMKVVPVALSTGMDRIKDSLRTRLEEKGCDENERTPYCSDWCHWFLESVSRSK